MTEYEKKLSRSKETVEELPDGGMFIRYPSGREEWRNRRGEFHRLDGPATTETIGQSTMPHMVTIPDADVRSVPMVTIRDWYICGKFVPVNELRTFLAESGLELGTPEANALLMAKFG